MDIESLAKELILKNMNPEQQLAVLEGIKTSVAQAKEVQKQRIGENVGLVIDALKQIEADIRSRFDEVGTAIEHRVNAIKYGRDGINGQDGKNGKDGLNGKQGLQGTKGKDGRDGRDGTDGVDGVSVTSAHIDFDGSLIIGLSSGVELNVGEVLAPSLAESIKVITNGGGTSQSVLDTLASLQTQITNLIPSQTGNSGKYLTTNGTTTSWASVAGGLSYQGTWNASTNTPTLASSTGTNGYYYIVGTSGSTNLNGITDWVIGDWLLFNGTVWQKIDQTNSVTSVNGQTGAVSVGTVTSVSALTLGTTGTDLSSTVATSTTTPVITLNVPTASATNRGVLSSADWTTFNNKGSGTVTSVSGTTGRITSTGGTTPVLDLTSGIATAGTTGSSTLIPVITIDTYGRVTGITTASNPQGTVTSVTGTSPVASSGGATPAISLASNYGDTQNPYASKTANYVLAAPNGSSGAPTFRAIVAADIPTLNQNTTGTASNVTGTVAIANGGTGQTTQAAALTALAGTQTSGRYLRSDGTNTSLSAIQAADVPTLNQNTTGTASNVTGIVVGANGGTGIANTGSTITVGGNLSHSGAFTQNFTATANTAVTLPAGATASSNNLLSSATAVGIVTGTPSSTNYLRGDGTWATITAGNASYDTATSSTGYFALSKGTTAQRPASPASGMIRYNTNNTQYEVYDGSAWKALTTQNVGYSASYLVAAGGAGGGGFAGGGAGGLLANSAILSVGTTYTVTVGGGGAGAGSGSSQGTNGVNSSISGSGLTTVTSTGGGGGGAFSNSAQNGLSGGSGGGGGAASSAPYTAGTVGSGTVGQGYDGGLGVTGATAGGGGGGSSAVGSAGSGATGGNGGAGTASSITGSSVTYAGGGGGSGATTGGTGGSGGGGNGGTGAGSAATVNTGGGGGGGYSAAGGNGGSGIVILSVLTANYSGTTTGSPTVTTSGSNTIIKFTSSGSYTA